jgi:hypothetical protein
MASDRTGLETPGANRKCLTVKNGKLGLGHCHERIRRQHFSFEYKNPHQSKALSAAAIIAWHTEQTLNDKPAADLPPVMNRGASDKNQKNISPEKPKTHTATQPKKQDVLIIPSPLPTSTKKPVATTTTTTTSKPASVKTTVATTTVRPNILPHQLAVNTTQTNISTRTAPTPIQPVMNKTIAIPITNITRPLIANPTTTKPTVRPTEFKNSTVITNTTTEMKNVTKPPVSTSDTSARLLNTSIEKQANKTTTPQAEIPVTTTKSVNNKDITTQSDGPDTDLPKNIQEFNSSSSFKSEKCTNNIKLVLR